MCVSSFFFFFIVLLLCFFSCSLGGGDVYTWTLDGADCLESLDYWQSLEGGGRRQKYGIETQILTYLCHRDNVRLFGHSPSRDKRTDKVNSDGNSGV